MRKLSQRSPRGRKASQIHCLLFSDLKNICFPNSPTKYVKNITLY